MNRSHTERTVLFVIDALRTRCGRLEVMIRGGWFVEVGSLRRGDRPKQKRTRQSHPAHPKGCCGVRRGAARIAACGWAKNSHCLPV